MGKCEFCGKELGTRKVEIPFAVGRFLEMVEPCDCQEAQRAAEERVRKADEEARAKEVGRVRDSARIPKRYLMQAPDARLVPDVMAGGSVYVHGIAGDGKTALACATALAYVEAQTRRWEYGWRCPKVVRFLCATDWTGAVRAAMDTRGLSEDDLLSKYGGCDLLVLDDLGKGKQTEWSVALLYRLVNRRYEDMLPTVYTSQYDLEALRERLTVNGDTDTAEAIVDRLHETCRVIRLGDVNRRRSLGF